MASYPYRTPGTGKTRWMDDNYGTRGWYRAPDNTGKWFDHCDRDVILFDDVKAHKIPSITQALHLTDRYPLWIKVHNKFILWKSRVIVFTSNYPPTDWWPNDPEVSYRAYYSEHSIMCVCNFHWTDADIELDRQLVRSERSPCLGRCPCSISDPIRANYIGKVLHIQKL